MTTLKVKATMKCVFECQVILIIEFMQECLFTISNYITLNVGLK